MTSRRRSSFGILCTVLLFCARSAFGQYSEVGVWGGVTNSFGDINNTLKSMEFTLGGGGIFYRYNMNPRIAMSIGLNAGETYGADSISKDPYQLLRNLSFRSYIVDFSARYEFNFLDFDRSKENEWFTPYVFAGLDLYYFNPQAYYNGNWVDLQPLGTEGQQFPELSGNDKYHRVQLGVPLGGGFKFALNENWTVGLEGNWHWLFTDYLDDVSTKYVDPAILATGDNGALAVALADRSTEMDVLPLGRAGEQRGDSRHNDHYLYTGIFISYTFVHLICPSPGKWGMKGH